MIGLVGLSELNLKPTSVSSQFTAMKTSVNSVVLPSFPLTPKYVVYTFVHQESSYSWTLAFLAASHMLH